MKDKISRFVSYLLPNRVVLWVIVRAFAYTSCHSHSNKTPDEIGYDLLWKSWDFKTRYKINDNGDDYTQR